MIIVKNNAQMEVRKPKHHNMLGASEQFDIVFLYENDAESAKEGSLSAGINPVSGNWVWWWSDSLHTHHGDKWDIKRHINRLRSSLSVTILLDTFSEDINEL